MRFDEILDLAPPQVSVATVEFRGHEMDVYRLVGEDSFAVLRDAPALAEAWSNTDEEVGYAPLMTAISDAGPAIINRLIVSGLRTNAEKLEKVGMDLEEQIDVILAIVENGIPKDFLSRLLGAVNSVTAQVRSEE